MLSNRMMCLSSTPGQLCLSAIPHALSPQQCRVGLKSYLMFPACFPHPHSVLSLVPAIQDLVFVCSLLPWADSASSSSGIHVHEAATIFLVFRAALVALGVAAGTYIIPALCPAALMCKILSQWISELSASFQKRTFISVDLTTPSTVFNNY